MSFPIQILFQDRTIFNGVIRWGVELGRQQHHEAAESMLHVLERQADDGAADRLIIAPLAETRIGRHQLRIEEAAGGESVRLINLSDKVPLEVVGCGILEPRTEITLPIPAEVALASKHRIQIGQAPQQKTLRSLGLRTIAPGKHLANIEKPPLEDLQLDDAGAERLLQAMQAAMDVFQSAQTQSQLFDSAVQGSLKLAGFDRAVVVMRESNQWIPHWGSGSHHEQTWPISQTVLNEVFKAKQTFWDSTTAVMSQTLTKIDGVIAAPILDAEDVVVGALYGDCKRNAFQHGPEAISRLQARLMELLACGVASGLSRIEQATRASQLKTQFEQYFTKKLAEELEANPNLIEGRDAEVSILFCDIRKFSRISERIGTEQTFRWINDVMEVLSACVNRNDGVLIDYIGDELMAMWGAPKPQQNHAQLACQAALDMLSCLPELEDRWRDVIREPFGIGIGVNSGRVRAGNTGSLYKFKYSPLGNTVNLASRVEGATKYLRTSALITGTTAELLDETIPKRRLCSVRVVNIEGPVPLYELGTPEGGQSTVVDYEHALEAFEQLRFRDSARILTELLQRVPDDGPSLVLLSRTVNALVTGSQPDHPVWTLDGK